MLFFKALSLLLLPSCFVFIVLIIGFVFIWQKKKKAGKILIIIGLALYYFFSITPIADLIVSPLENKYQPLEKTSGSGEDIVLLLGGVRPEKLPLTSSLPESTLFRTMEAVNIYFSEKDGKKIIISGSDPLFPDKKAGLSVKKFIENINVSPKDIILEDRSRNTYESAQEIKKIIGEKPFILVTSAYHMPRSVYAFKKVGLNPIAAPADFKKEGEYNLLDFFPNAENLKKSDLAFHEYFGALFYYLK